MAPYSKASKRSWWNTGVVATTPETIEDIYIKRFELTEDDLIATAGSCFAQHLSRHMRERGYRIFDGEPAPFGLSVSSAREFGYGVYSCRYGNIYHVRQLLQLLQEAMSGTPRADIAWARKGRHFDALRPSVEPTGLDSEAEVYVHRKAHLDAVMRMIRRSTVFVFTLGLTEAWVDGKTGVVYPIYPGVYSQTVAERSVFHNFTVGELVADFLEFRRLVHQINPDMRFIVTVSPVPLIATASDDHVLVATTASKSILRAVTQELYSRCEDIDYFPSYEIISSPWSKGRFFEDDLRSVTEVGVSTVMRSFFLQHGSITGAQTPDAGSTEAAEEIICDEELLQAFQK